MFGGIPFSAFAGGGGPNIRFAQFGGPMGGEDMGGHASNADTTKLYETLGVDKEATQSQIKKAYMLRAKKEHPDKGGDPEKFKELQHAYDILGDEEKRRLYDAGGEDAVESGGAGGGPSDIFDALFGGGGRRARSGPVKGEPTVHPIKVGLEDLYSGKEVNLAVTRTIYEKDASGSVMDNTGQRYSKRTERKVLNVVIEKGM
jgi:DnaJ family protein A protein 2